MLQKTWPRIIYQLFAIVFTALVLNRFALNLQQFISIRYSFYFELAMVIGQLIFQSAFIFRRPVRVILNYWFQLLTVSLIGSALLLLFIGLQQFVDLNAYVCLVYFLCVVVIMFLEHKRRVALLALPWYLSFTWLLYRSLILVFIL
ncbi:MAG: hypothetical protein EOP49_52515 [Sphingobacteriales bacterium]|nr:MAG: hypothetical protein EOP49_52515 [Sphingobacteriales bacterium]